MEQGASPLTTTPVKTTFYQNMSVVMKKVVNTLAVDSTGNFAVLGGKKGLYIVELDNPEEPAKTLTQQSKWEVGVVEWNPHFARKAYIASAANQNILIWNVDEARMELQATLQTHQRAVSDLSWSLFDLNVLATCSADTFINLWDVRDPKKPIKRESFCGWTAGATQVKWNRFNPMTLASAHNGEVRIWDIRKVSSPTTFITAHMAKIYGLDWSYTEENDIVTCSEDKQVKFWNVTLPRVCKGTLQSGVPILRAKYMPFGNGLVTMASRGDNTIKLWSLFDLNTPIKQLSGHTDLVTAFDWRIRKNPNGKKEYQLVSWSKDQTLRLWFVDNMIQEVCKEPSRSAPVAIGSSHSSSFHSDFSLPSSDISARSISPIDKFSPSPFVVKDLVQEFKMLEKKKPRNVVIEEMSVTDRTCIASTGSTKVKITFPSLYPLGAAPSFQFLPNSTLSTQTQVKMIEVLTETALFHVQHNRPCLYQCLCQLVLLSKENSGDSSLDDDRFLDDDITGEFRSTSPTFSGIPIQTRINLENDNIPAPRTSGAVFGGVGRLFYFCSFKHSTGNGGPRLRTYRELKVHVNKVSSISSVPSEEPAFSIPAYFYAPQKFQQEMIVKSSPLTLRSSASIISNTQQLHQPTMSVSRYFSVKDLSYLAPLDQSLGQFYTLSGNVDEICEANLVAAKSADRKDLVQLWSLVKILSNKKVCNGPWANNHPMGRHMLTSIFNHYKRLRDVQTLAILSCVLTLCDVESAHGDGETESPERVRKKASRVVLLDPQLENMYDQFKDFYGEILYKWELLDKRSEVLKLVKRSASVQSKIAYSGVCYRCEKPLQDTNLCSSCKTFGFSCSICHVAVRGISNCCMACGHGGHTAHMAQWFKTEASCPSGCGCECLEENNWELQ